MTREIDPKDWGRIVIAKINVVDVLRRELKSLRPNKIFIGTITDPYQPVEALYKLTRKALDVILRNNVRVSIQTKNSLILRDLDILLNNRNLVDVGITITTLNSKVSRKYEPLASPPQARVKTLRTLSSNGIKTWIFVGPIIPKETDDINMLKEIILLAKETKSFIIFDKFRVKDFMMEKWCKIRGVAMEAIRYNWKDLYAKIDSICKELNVRCQKAFS